jgi:hypothetical protein
VGTPKGILFPSAGARGAVGRTAGPLWGISAALLTAFAALLGRMRAIDLAYHVRAGELSLAGGVVTTDPFTFTRGGRPWLNQQWAAQVAYRLAHRSIGWVGVALAYAASIGAGFWFLYRSCRRAGARSDLSALLIVLAFLVGAPSLGARPQALAVPLFTGTWLLLSRRDRWTWLVPLLAVIWANVHGSFVLAPLLAAFSAGDAFLERRSVGRSVALFLTTTVATFVTPFGPAVWSYTLDIAGNETIRSTVAEWRPPTPLTLGGAVFWLSGVAVAVLGVTRRRTTRPIDVIRLVVFFALGIPAMRSTLWWALAAPPVVAGWIPAEERVDDPEHAADRASRGSVGVVAAGVLLLLPIAVLLRSGNDPTTGAPARLAWDAPQTLVEATGRELPAGSRLLVFQPYASWFEYALPEDPVMVDSRIELFPSAVWRDYDLAISASDGWERVLDRYDIRGVVVPPASALGRELSRTDGWDRVVDTAAGSVFVRT